MNIAMVSVHVHDPLKAFKFYTEILGFIEKMYMPEAYLAIVASSEQPDGTQLMLEPSNNPIAKAYMDGLYQSGIPAMTFGTSDIQTEYERLKERGVVFRKEPTKNDWGTDAIFDDTCGNYIQLYQA